MKLPFLISVPHAGIEVPPEVTDTCILTRDDIIADGDEGARDIYDIRDDVAVLVTTDIARAIIDVNRREDDRGADGIVKTHTIWNVPVYRSSLPDELVARLIDNYYRPYHHRLSSPPPGVVLGIDCHTMAAAAPPIDPDAGRPRPDICVSNGDGTCPDEWMKLFSTCLQRSFGLEVRENDPFRGGYIIRVHSSELPWIQVEISRGLVMRSEEKKTRFLTALSRLYDAIT